MSSGVQTEHRIDYENEKKSTFPESLVACRPIPCSLWCAAVSLSVFLVSIFDSTLPKFSWQGEVKQHVWMGWEIIPEDRADLHWQKDNSNDIPLISCNRFGTWFSLAQKWIREQ